MIGAVLLLQMVLSAFSPGDFDGGPADFGTSIAPLVTIVKNLSGV